MAFSEAKLGYSKIQRCGVWAAGSGRPVVALAGPPVSALLFRHWYRPFVEDGGARLILPELYSEKNQSHSLGQVAERLSTLIEPDTILIAQGWAVPLAKKIAQCKSLGGLCLIDGSNNGLGSTLGVIASMVRRMPGLMTHVGFHLSVFVTLAASSLGLRRAVINPYIMNRDIVAMLSAPTMATTARRRALVEYLASLDETPADWTLDGTPELQINDERTIGIQKRGRSIIPFQDSRSHRFFCKDPGIFM